MMKAGDRDTLVWMQNAEPLSLYCGDETDGETLRACEQINESLYGYEIGGTERRSRRWPTECTANDDLDRLDLHAARRREVPRRRRPRRQRRRRQLRGQWDTEHPLHIGRTGAFEYWSGLWGGFLNPPPPDAEQSRRERAQPDGGVATRRPCHLPSSGHRIRLAERAARRPMTRFIVRRLLVTIPVLFGIVFIVFVLARLIPGDPCRAVLGERATDAVCDDFIHRYGLDQPIPIQFGALPRTSSSRGDLGTRSSTPGRSPSSSSSGSRRRSS